MPQDFRNRSGLKFTDISSEKERCYHFPNGQTYKIKNPLRLHVSHNGGHRVFDGTQCHYVHPKEGWAICWTVKQRAQHFVI